MARNRKQRRQQHGSAWHWKQTDSWRRDSRLLGGPAAGRFVSALAGLSLSCPNLDLLHDEQLAMRERGGEAPNTTRHRSVRPGALGESCNALRASGVG